MMTSARGRSSEKKLAGAEGEAPAETVVLDVVLEHRGDLGEVEARPGEVGVGEGDLDGQVALGRADVREGGA